MATGESMMDLGTFINISRALQNNGDSVVAQLEAVFQGDDLADQNPNALKIIAKFLIRYGSELDGAADLAVDILQYLKDQE